MFWQSKTFFIKISEAMVLKTLCNTQGPDTNAVVAMAKHAKRQSNISFKLILKNVFVSRITLTDVG